MFQVAIVIMVVALGALHGCGKGTFDDPGSRANQKNPRSGGNGPRVRFAFVTLDGAALMEALGNRGGNPASGRAVEDIISPFRLAGP